MKNRSLVAVFLLSVITLGLYELYWLVATRNEMVAKFGAKIPSGVYAVVVNLLQLVGLAALIVILLVAIPSNNRLIDQALAHKPSPECYAQYNQSAACKQQIDSYYVADNSTSLVFWSLAIIVAMGVIFWFYINRFIRPYLVGVEKVIGRKLPLEAIIVAILLPMVGMLLIQRAFNQIQPSSSPS